MKIKNSLLFFLASLFISCSSHIESNSDIGLVFDQEILDQFVAYEKSIISTKIPLLFESGVTVQSCEDYYKEKINSAVSEGINNKIAFQEYLICDTLLFLKESGVELTFDNALNIGIVKSLYQKLDLRTMRSSLSPLLEENDIRLQDITGMEFQVKPDSVSLVDSEWDFAVKIIALVDFDKDGHRDILAWMYDRSKNNTYVDYQVLIIKKENGLFIAE